MKKITVYSNTGCGKCDMLKKWLDVKGLEYEEKNISQDSSARNFIISHGLRSVPQVTLDSELIQFNEYNDILELI